MVTIILNKSYLQKKVLIKIKQLIIKSPFSDFFQKKDKININDLRELYDIITEKKVYPKDDYMINGLIDLIWTQDNIIYDEINYNYLSEI